MDIDDEVVGREFPLENYGSNADRFSDMMSYITSLEEKVRIQSLRARLALAEHTRDMLRERALHPQKLADNMTAILELNNKLAEQDLLIKSIQDLAEESVKLINDNFHINNPVADEIRANLFTIIENEDLPVLDIDRRIAAERVKWANELRVRINDTTFVPGVTYHQLIEIIDTFREESRVLAESSSPAPNAP